jgi:DNA-binding winged helix-turn-helix (wHTH) protein/Tfp pilus assembly protein PilF
MNPAPEKGMSMSVRYRFGTFTFESPELILKAGGVRLDLPRKTLCVLEALLESAPAPISKDDLLDRVWADRDVLDANVAQHVYRLRGIIDRGLPFSSIATISRHGYRFAMPVSRAAGIDTSDDWLAHARAHQLLESRIERNLRRTIDEFDGDSGREPNAAILADLAMAWCLLAEYLFEDPRTAFARSRELAASALALDSHRAEPYVALAECALYHDADYSAAREYYERAAWHAPSSALVRVPQAWFFCVTGDGDAAIEALAPAVAADPSAPSLNVALAVYHIFSREFASAVRVLRNVRSIDPSCALATYYLSMALALDGRATDAREVLDEQLAREYPQQYLTSSACADAAIGNREAAAAGLRRLRNLGNRRYVSALNEAKICLALGDRDGYTRARRAALERPDPWVVFVDRHPYFEEFSER